MEENAHSAQTVKQVEEVGVLTRCDGPSGFQFRLPLLARLVVEDLVDPVH